MLLCDLKLDWVWIVIVFSEKELNYWTMTFGTMAGQAALIAGNIVFVYFVGFSYGGLTIAIPEGTSGFLSIGYLTTTTLAMGFGLLAITIATFVNKSIILLKTNNPHSSAQCLVQDLPSEAQKVTLSLLQPY